jgi:alpha-glucosidase
MAIKKSKSRLKIHFFALLVFLSLAIQSCSQSSTVSSPDGRILITFILKNGMPFYTVQKDQKPIILESALGIKLKGQLQLDSGFKVALIKTSTFDETWTQPWGEQKAIRNHYNEMYVDLGAESGKEKKLSIIFRAFDDGIGFRYVIPGQSEISNIEIMDELTQFKLAGDHTSWWNKAYQWNRYEYLYESSPVSKIDTVHTPFTMQTADGLFLSIHEAALTDYASMTLANNGNLVLEADLVPWSDGVKVRGTAPLKSPWRTMQIANSAGGLITSYLILNLNEPNKLGDVSWVEPGKYVGIWWEMHLEKSSWASGVKHGATTKNAKKYIDFAAENGFKGVLVEGWNLGWDGNWLENGDKFNFTKAYDDFDIEEVTAYGAKKGVGLIGHHETGGGVLNYESQLEEAFAFYKSLGVKAVKTGYVNYAQGIKRIDETGKIRGEWHHGQFMVRHYRHVVEVAAKNHIMLDVHEPIKDTGIRRTYPNMMTREGARGQEYNAWSPDGGNPPDHTTILPFTRLLGGPMDFTPGIFDLLFEKAKPNNRVNTTLMKQLALYVVLYSPLHMAADLIENYQARPEPFKFIKDVPTDWQTTIVVNGVIGDYVTIVRKDRNSDDWYLGSITDEQQRDFEVSLDFLDPGKNYKAEIYRDGNEADWKTNPYDFIIDKQKVDHQTTLKIRLAPGGGQAVRFSPSN